MKNLVASFIFVTVSSTILVSLIGTSEFAHADQTFTICESLLNSADGLYFSLENVAPTPNASEIEFMYLNIKNGLVQLRLSFGGDYNGTSGWGKQCEPVAGTKLRTLLSLDESYYRLFQGQLKCSNVELASGKKEDVVIDINVDADHEGSVKVTGPTVNFEMPLKSPTH
jgi:hypothetical protein